MYIKRIELFHIAIPCLQPFVTSFGTIDTRPALIIRMISDTGIVGYGESSPLDVPISEPETTGGAVQLLKKILPHLIGVTISPEFDIQTLYGVESHPVSLIGIEGAYLDLAARAEGIPLHALFGGKQHSVTLGESVGLKESPEEVITEIRKYVAQDVTRIKVKIEPGRDVEIIRAVRETFPDLKLGADANAAYAEADIPHLAQLKEYELTFVEQPFAAADLASHAELRQIGIRICLDESATNLDACVRAISANACDMINIKPARIGSFRETKVMHDYCLAQGITLFGGGRLETGIGKNANAHVYTLPGFTEASDITPPSEYLESDIITPSFTVVDGAYTPMESPGIGVALNNEVIRTYLCEHCVFE